jgi:thiol-disulfide isomerase/thioredoxin
MPTVRLAWLAAALLLLLAALARPAAYRVARHFGFVAAPPPLQAGDRLVLSGLDTLDGAPVDLRSGGHPMVINIFATWCGPCNAEVRDLSIAARTLHARHIEVVGIDRAEPSAVVAAYAARNGLAFPMYVDRAEITKARLSARFIPTTVFVNADGTIRRIYAGPLDSSAFISLATSRS